MNQRGRRSRPSRAAALSAVVAVALGWRSGSQLSAQHDADTERSIEHPHELRCWLIERTLYEDQDADLVRLDANPLANIAKIRAVVANGRYFDRASLDTLVR